MRAILLFMVVIAISSQALAANSAQIIGKEVSKLANMFSGGLASRVEKPRAIIFGNLFSHRNQDAVAYFVLEGVGGGNGTAEYLAFFESIDPLDFVGHSTKRYRLITVS
jgi:hypothetical protein